MATQELRYDVHVSDLVDLPTPSPLQPPGGEPPRWSPVSSTLIYGPTEAVLTDPQITVDQAERLAEWVRGFRRTLRAVYVTHAHGDHWYGAATLLAHFPDAVVYATEEVIAEMQRTTPDGRPSALFADTFPGQLSATPVVAQPVPAGGLTVDGHALHAIDVGHSDTDNSTVLHAPSIGLVVAGDVIYNNVHQFVGESADGGLAAWLAAIDVVESLDPRFVVAGHKDKTRADDPSIIAETRDYLVAMAKILGDQPTRAEFFRRVLAEYPGRLNPTSVWLSAVRLLPA
jgi:glyoxylase-like metal-dependent hydrolase (beta-lactamase superfamily II)